MNQSYIEEIQQSQFVSDVIKRRLLRECKEMTNNFYEIIIKSSLDDGMTITFKKNNNKYLFIIPTNYPFETPILYVNNVHCNYLFDLKTNRFRSILKYITNLDCLCCNSFNCKYNWSPAITFNKIITQIEDYKTIKYHICLKILLDKIKNTYLNKDIDLESWFFTPKRTDSYICV